jgi:hypothetical protein
MTEPAPACDECCGHGCEDGWCVHFDDADGILRAMVCEHNANAKAQSKLDAIHDDLVPRLRGLALVLGRSTVRAHARPFAALADKIDATITGGKA